MHTLHASFVASLALLSLSAGLVSAADDAADGRTPWTTSRISGSPEPPLPYTTERAFPKLKFNQCLDIAMPPGSDRFFVLEQSGKVFSFPNRQDVEKADLAIDIKQEIEGVNNVYAITFHPQFQENGYCYICVIGPANQEDGTKIIRLQVRDTNPPTIDASDATTLITWWSGGHNGSCLKFGPDGYLYISTGDGAPANPPDTKKAGQDVSNLLSCILRIDVDHTDDGLPYGIPHDNPFVDREGARGEIWAYGFRNPWRMSFDAKTGDLWVGDVGWEAWEMLDRVVRGGNYGWAVTEGSAATHPEWPRGPTPILPPTIEHPHTESSSVTGGLTYYGQRLPGLQGHHIYGDYDTGKFWSFRWHDGQVVDHAEIADGTLRIVGFGQDHEGEFYILDHPAGTIHRMVPNKQEDKSKQFPRRLSDSGLFKAVAEQVPAPGVLPYSISAEPWMDHALAKRFAAIPGDATIKPGNATWSFPQESVLVKTLSLDMEAGNAAARRKIETQILHFDGTEWYPYTYRWNDEQSDAELVEAAGAEATFDVVDASAPRGQRRQVWRFAGRGECQRCHNKWSGPPLAFNTPQLNRAHADDAELGQLDLFARIQLIEPAVADDKRPQLADPHDETADVESRARAYLQVNCAHCHRMHAGGSVLSKMHYDVPLSDTNMVDVRPTQGTFGIHAARVIAPGDPLRSVLLYRMAKLGGGRMPHIGSTEVDSAGIELMHQWLGELPHEDTAGLESVAKLRNDESSRLAAFLAATATDRAKVLGELLSTTSGALMLLRAIDQGDVAEEHTQLAVTSATTHNDIRIRDLFERFLPPEQRVKRLGSVVDAQQILKLPGDASRGRDVFFATAGVACKNCHRIDKQGKEVGPDLSQIGKKQDRGQLLESILEPSKRIDPKYVTYLVETDEGKLFTGLLVSKDEQQVILKDAQDKQLRIPTDSIEELAPQRRSLMPELLLRDMTAQQVADLLEYLVSLQ